MIASETIEDFYGAWHHTIPDSLKTGIGHFNVFKFEDLNGCSVKPIPFNRRNYFKISLIIGKNVEHYSNKSITVEKQALLFACPNVPYNWEQINPEQNGYSCVFTEDFFHHFGKPKDYLVFQTDGTPIMELDDDQVVIVKQIFEEMGRDWSSNFRYKYDRMRILVYQLLHFAVKLHPVPEGRRDFSNASQKIATEFLELLEQQFPADATGSSIRLRSSSDFAARLSVHVNHLNKVSKEIFNKPTSTIIQERLLTEAKVLLKHTNGAVSEIAYTLGFKEKTHFTNFFKKHTQLSPTQFRNI